MASKLPYVLECKSSYPFFETIAAFDCEPPAKKYAASCAEANPTNTYRVVKRGKVLTSYAGAGQYSAVA